MHHKRYLFTRRLKESGGKTNRLAAASLSVLSLISTGINLPATSFLTTILNQPQCATLQQLTLPTMTVLYVQREEGVEFDSARERNLLNGEGDTVPEPGIFGKLMT